VDGWKLLNIRAVPGLGWLKASHANLILWGEWGEEGRGLLLGLK